MTANEIIAALESLPNGGSATLSSSGGRKLVTFAAFTGVGRQCFRESSADESLLTGLNVAFDSVKSRLDALNQ